MDRRRGRYDHEAVPGWGSIFSEAVPSGKLESIPTEAEIIVGNTTFVPNEQVNVTSYAKACSGWHPIYPIPCPLGAINTRVQAGWYLNQAFSGVYSLKFETGRLESECRPHEFQRRGQRPVVFPDVRPLCIHSDNPEKMIVRSCIALVILFSASSISRAQCDLELDGLGIEPLLRMYCAHDTRRPGIADDEASTHRH